MILNMIVSLLLATADKNIILISFGQSEQKFQIKKFAGGDGKEKEPISVKY